MVSSVWQEYILSRGESRLTVASAEGSRGFKHTRIKITGELRVKLRDWLREWQLYRTRTVAKDVVRFMVEQGKLESAVLLEEKARKPAIRMMQRVLVHLGMQRSIAPGCTAYKDKKRKRP